MKQFFSKLTAAVLVLTLLTCTASALPPSGTKSYDPPVNFGVLSDPHFYPEEYTNLNSAEYMHDAYCDSKIVGESEAIMRATLKTIAARKADGTYNMNYLLIPGDLTFDGEKAGHIKLASLFKDFERNTGIQIFVINGNHDVNNYDAADYATADGKKINAHDNPGLLLTTPENFRTIYADFGYNQADSCYTPSTGKAGGLSYAVSLPGGYRLIAIDSCKYSADITSGGNDIKQGDMNITPELLQWVLKQTKEAAEHGEAVIGMVHGSVVEHFNLERVLSKNALIKNYEEISYQLADAGMHFIFSGHMHANDVASIVSADNETIYDIETCELSSFPNTYREASFSKGLVQGYVTCKLNNVDCDAAANVDVSGVSAKYGVIEKPFSENYCMPILYGGSIENGIRSDASVYFDNSFLFRATDALHRALPNGIAGLLKEKGIDIGEELTGNSSALKTALKGYNLTPEAFSQFLNAVISKIDDKYILNTSHTAELLSSVVKNFSHFELVKGDSATEFGKIALLALEYSNSGDEDTSKHPEITRAAAALRTQAGADRLVDKLLDIIINDVLFDDILPSINLNDLDIILPGDVMQKLHKIAGDNISVGGILDKILNSSVKIMNTNPFVHVDNGRDLVKALVYTAGYMYINDSGRLKAANSFADVIDSFTKDENPFFCGDLNATLEYKGKAAVKPTSDNFRLPADISIAKGANKGDVIIEWHTITGINSSDIDLNPLPAGAIITQNVEKSDITVDVVDFNFMTLSKPRTVLKHTVVISGLETGQTYSFSIGDKEKGLMSETSTFKVRANGEIKTDGIKDINDFFTKLSEFLKKIFEFIFSFNGIIKLFT